MKTLKPFIITLSFVCLFHKAFTQAEQKLSFTFMNLQEVQIDSAKIPFITELDLSGNPFTDLPSILVKAEKL